MLPLIPLKYLFFAFILLAVGLEIIADILFKKWATENTNLLLITGLLLYFLGTAFWAFSLKYEFLSKAISIFSVLNLIIVALVGIFYFKEDITILNKIGIALGVLSIILIEL